MADVQEGRLFRITLDAKEVQNEISYSFNSDSDETTVQTKDGSYTVSTTDTETIDVTVAFSQTADNDSGGTARLLMSQIYTWRKAKTQIPFTMGATYNGGPLWSGNVKVLSFSHDSDAGQDVVQYSYRLGIQGDPVLGTFST